MNIRELVKEAHGTSVRKGWYDGGAEAFNVPEKLALVHSEISEALEEYRNHRVGHLGDIRFEGDNLKPEGFAVELADAVIRIGDLCGAMGIDLAEALEVKMRFNKTRPHRHGGKRC